MRSALPACSQSLFSREGLIRYILCCCQDQTKRGGLRDKPGKYDSHPFPFSFPFPSSVPFPSPQGSIRSLPALPAIPTTPSPLWDTAITSEFVCVCVCVCGSSRWPPDTRMRTTHATCSAG